MLGELSTWFQNPPFRACPALSNQTICLLSHIKHFYYSHVFRPSLTTAFTVFWNGRSHFFLFKCVSSSFLIGMASHPPIPILELADHIERLKANDNLKFSQEYEVIHFLYVTEFPMYACLCFDEKN